MLCLSYIACYSCLSVRWLWACLASGLAGVPGDFLSSTISCLGRSTGTRQRLPLRTRQSRIRAPLNGRESIALNLFSHGSRAVLTDRVKDLGVQSRVNSEHPQASGLTCVDQELFIQRVKLRGAFPEGDTS